MLSNRQLLIDSNISHVSNAWTWWMMLHDRGFCSETLLALPPSTFLVPLGGKWLWVLLLVPNSNQSNLSKLAEALTARAQELFFWLPRLGCFWPG